MAGVLALTLALGMGTAYAQVRGLDDAIEHVTGELSASIGAGTSIAVVSMYAGTARMSNYLINEMIDTFVRAGRFTVVDRAQLELTARELDFSMSGEVDDLTAQLAGRRIGAQTIVTGAFEPHGANFRLRARIIQVEGAIIQGASNSTVPRNDPIAVSLLGADAIHDVVALPVAQGGMAPFTAGQRWGTWALNGLVPGLGSFLIMRDTFGGTFQAAVGGLGTILFFGGAIDLALWISYDVEVPLTSLAVGGVLLLTSGIFNIARSATFTPRTRISSIVDPDAWNIAVMPGKNGIERFYLSHTVRF